MEVEVEDGAARDSVRMVRFEPLERWPHALQARSFSFAAQVFEHRIGPREAEWHTRAFERLDYGQGVERMQPCVSLGQQTGRAREQRWRPQSRIEQGPSLHTVHDREDPAERAWVSADVHDAGHREAGFRERVLECPLPGRLDSTLGVLKNPDDQPPGEVRRRALELECVDEGGKTAQYLHRRLEKFECGAL